ncbi:SMP-30/gluconolactonase/LRE family protein [Zavarzinella formosa]|uniref:SMP-30/gluconolactonase/LRE family protein n=1 Tax=Zavarzinella formosa TaxID=360055 RepID=UPI0012FA42B9|nr:SMP-30/gluconolactonase/LRE family protein [Zavarzinella formosa]
MPRACSHFSTATLLFVTLIIPAFGAEPTGDLAKLLADVKFDHYSDAYGYSEGPTWRKGEVFFCSGALLRVDAQKKFHRYLEINPAGTVLKGDGHLLVADNMSKAILDVSPEGKAGVIVDQVNGQPLRGLNDLTVDAKGNIYWSDPEGSTPTNPVGNIYRVRPDGKADLIGGGLAFPNGLDVDPASKFLYVIESQTKKILRYALPADNKTLGKPELFYDLGGSGGDGCVFDAEGNLWVADFHRPETGKGRITVLSPEGKVLAYLPVPAKVVSNITFGGPDHDEIFCTTGEPPGVFHAKVGVKGFAGHPGKPMAITRMLNLVPMKPHPDAELVKRYLKRQVEKDPAIENFAFRDKQLQTKLATFLSAELKPALTRQAAEGKLLDEIRRLVGKATREVFAPDWLREITGDEALSMFSRIVEIDLNENTDGHKVPTPKKPGDRVTDDWLKQLAGQTELRNLQLSGTAVTSSGLVHLKGLTNLERLNVCLTAVGDEGFEHLAGLTKMQRITVCASKVTGSGFQHLGGMKQLVSINLHSSPASDAGLEAIGKLTSLKRLEVVHTKVTDAGLKHLAGLTNLRQLHVHGPETTEAGFSFLPQLKQLEQLDIYDRGASNATLEQIAKLPALKNLMLVIGVFDDEGLKAIAKMTTLEELSLQSPKITDACVETLGNLKGLVKLHLHGKFTPAGREKLKILLPGTEITFAGS